MAQGETSIARVTSAVLAYMSDEYVVSLQAADRNVSHGSTQPALTNDAVSTYLPRVGWPNDGVERQRNGGLRGRSTSTLLCFTAVSRTRLATVLMTGLGGREQ